MADAEHERGRVCLPVFEGWSAEGARREVERTLGVPCAITRRRWVFEEFVAGCGCGVVVLADVAESHVEWLDHLAHQYPQWPVIIVVPLSANTARLLAEAPTKHRRIVWLDEVTTRLPAVLDDLSALDPVQTVLAELSQSLADHPLVARTLAVVASAQRPFAKVADLAMAMNVPENTLRSSWNQATGGDLALKEVLEWTLLLRALSARDLGASRMAYRVGVHPRTLERIVRRRLSTTLGRLRRQRTSFIVEAFKDRVWESVG